jgi:hypothetical protein
MKLSYEFRRRCEMISTNQRQLLKLAPHAPLQGEALAEWHGIMLCEPGDMPGVKAEEAADLANRTDWDGVLLPNLPNHAPVILLRPTVSPTRRQSTIMHEIAHLLLRHAPLEWDAHSGEFEARRKLEETEAAYLGGCLQIPHIGLIWAVQTGLTLSRTALHFNASEHMVKYRADVMRVRLAR